MEIAEHSKRRWIVEFGRTLGVSLSMTGLKDKFDELSKLREQAKLGGGIER